MSLNEYNELYDAKKKINKIIGELYRIQKEQKDLGVCQDCTQYLLSIACNDIAFVLDKK